MYKLLEIPLIRFSRNVYLLHVYNSMLYAKRVVYSGKVHNTGI